ncbi:Hypothetical predicted protein, partial [Pelobates cultripes]
PPPPSPMDPPPPNNHTTEAQMGFSPALLTYWSNNTGGLNQPEKRSHLLRRLWAERVSVAFLQEMHFRGPDAPKLENKRFNLAYYANHPDAKRAGVAILFAHTVPFRHTATHMDPGGRSLFVK